jgi:SAM-dependent methyltransferase
MSSPWYATWFNTPHYHDLYQHRDLSEARDFIVELCRELGVVKGQKALDIACGRGRHALVLSEQGLDTIGIDLSAESIEYARQFEHEHLSFQIGNMLEPLQVHPAHWVFNLFTSFGYFESDEDHALAIQHMANALLPGGKLVLDYMNSAKIAASLVPTETVRTELAEYHITRKLEHETIVKTIRFDDQCSIQYFEERVRAFSAEALQNFMIRAGLDVQSIHGDYDLSPYDATFSDRLLIIAQKPEV